MHNRIIISIVFLMSLYFMSQQVLSYESQVAQLASCISERMIVHTCKSMCVYTCNAYIYGIGCLDCVCWCV